MWPEFHGICLTVEENPGRNLNQEIDPMGDRTRARCLRSNDVTSRLQRWSIWNVNTEELTLLGKIKWLLWLFKTVYCIRHIRSVGFDYTSTSRKCLVLYTNITSRTSFSAQEVKDTMIANSEISGCSSSHIYSYLSNGSFADPYVVGLFFASSAMYEGQPESKDRLPIQFANLFCSSRSLVSGVYCGDVENYLMQLYVGTCHVVNAEITVAMTVPIEKPADCEVRGVLRFLQTREILDYLAEEASSRVELFCCTTMHVHILPGRHKPCCVSHSIGSTSLAVWAILLGHFRASSI